MERVQDQLGNLTVEIRAAAFKALQESAEAVRSQAASNVRVDTRNLQESVKARFENSRLRAEIGWWDADDLYAALHEHGTRRIPANPVLGPALEQERARIGDRIKEQVRRSTR
ncbi:HK97-gp10 family putative phage morphogenesis protein [Streptomyces parvus]|uniref:HK97-gp10 family putative phage morphogenesis protein n=1 Tax=Streptomyces parvus TaxID=66428 RepID=UPI00331AC8F7